MEIHRGKLRFWEDAVHWCLPLHRAISAQEPAASFWICTRVAVSLVAYRSASLWEIIKPDLVLER
tara:strand:+ start:6641 stop:6835 length:195 start_codon:yes stop_codon:yes gene_type:complete